MNAEEQLQDLYDKEKQLENALSHVREQIRELINYTDKNKGTHDE